ncbi:hypothetical protein CFE70_001234 [Pyrenophora teres f. teres 0-1]|nr:hypothetical protein HRS9139_09989 [Pyrenophora teres f. teres]KAE8826221.1 hypothetical protein PTNB85_09166 [Pyrenophora teres f. teres]KAE8832766.1 hypothetical protein HRS9122_08479 [Pyrenophora teres f. teres]KAE8852719.1 hypothetical protein PTNB29_10109 [Pyrenophora teres f. teres]KAE8856567.1 hypothetical protein PTNB73_09832 [Pyrenophora teres f. teres]
MGSLVWTGNYTEPFDFRVQTYRGDPVLTLWSGELLNGFGRGSYHILNQSYDEIAHFQVDRFGEDMGDIHEFGITGDDTALVIIYHGIPWDLTASGGIENGWLFENTFQEINIETGELVFEWNASTHIGINESYNSLPSDVGQSEGTPWDYFHMNSVEKDNNGDYLVSARVMDCIYKISGQSGNIIWRLQGKQSDFDVDPAANFAFQHDARWLDQSQTRLTLFDNGPTDTIGYSRGLLLSVDQTAKTAKLLTEFSNSAKTFAMYEGNLQAIDPTNETTNYMLGYGSEPFFAELDYQGNILLDVQFGKSNVVNAYRTLRQQWQGKPATNPDMHWDREGKKAYFSWNGATNVDSWAILTANASDAPTWTNVTTARRTGFETVVDLAGMQLQEFLRGKAVGDNEEVLRWTLASDGVKLYDAPDDVEESAAVASSTMTSSTRGLVSSRTEVATSSTEVAASSSSSGVAVAARATHGVMEQVYVAAAVVVGGLVFM